MEDFFKLYGPVIVYTAIFFGSLVEGESVVLTCSILAYKYDTISMPILILLAFMGSTCADQSLFLVGRKFGPRILAQRKNWKEKVDRVFYYMHKHSTLFIISFRFIYGIRTISPIVIGASGFEVKRFAMLNLFAALLWACMSCGLGYLLGHLFMDQIEEFFSHFAKYKKTVATVVISAIALVCVWRLAKDRLFSKKD